METGWSQWSKMNCIFKKLSRLFGFFSSILALSNEYLKYNGICFPLKVSEGFSELVS